MSTPIDLAQGFPTPDIAHWRALAEKALKGAPFERLVETTFDGIKVQPLYTSLDVTAPEAPLLSARDPFLPWDIRQSFEISDATLANQAILADLQGGASSLELQIGGGQPGGFSAPHLGEVLRGVLFNLAPVGLNAGPFALDAARALDQSLVAAKADPQQARPAFNLEFASTWLNQGGLPASFEALMADAVTLGLELAQRWPKAKVFVAAGQAAHEAGASPAQELAIMLASGVAALRALEAAGVAPAQAAHLILLRLAVGQDVVLEMAKMRAARLLWARVLTACGVTPEPAQLQAVTSARMLARNDAWSNILRVTCATFAAAAGGADVITALPLTKPLGAPGPLASRIARNTQLILMEETHLGHVADPGAGAFAVEALTQDLAEAAWAVFQQIEGQGGIAAALRSGWIQGEIARSAAAQARDVARRKRPITGVSNHPLPGEALPDFVMTLPPHATDRPMHDPITAMPWTRLSEPFEALRAAGESAGSPPVFFANLGKLPDFSARAGFARNLLAVGGLSTPHTEAVYPDMEALVAAFTASGLKCAVICSSDAIYADHAKACAQALKAAGATHVLLAGRPMEGLEVDQFIFAGQDALDALAQVHAALGVSS
jgi:methylmalonyl-CoA mutase